MQSLITRLKHWLGRTSELHVTQWLATVMEAVAVKPLIYPMRRRPVTRWSDRSYPSNVSVIHSGKPDFFVCSIKSSACPGA